MTFPFGKTVTVIPQTVDVRTGDRTPGAPVMYDGVACWQTPGVETTGGEQTVVWDLTCLFPVGAAVSVTDRVEVDGQMYEVVGQPIQWQSALTGWKPGVEIHLAATVG